jgi:prepilin-type N-terminal cleavage/methylation domain-containing protein
MARTRGFTLLEILVAVAVLGIALVSLLGLQARNVRLATEGQDVTVATMLAARLVAETRAEGFAKIGVTKGRFSAEEPESPGADEGTGSVFGDGFRDAYGGSSGADFAWRREITPFLTVPTLREVRISVFRAEDADDEDARPLAVLVFLIRGLLQ